MMKILVLSFLFLLSFTACVSREKYETLNRDLGKAKERKEKLDEQLNQLNIRQQHLLDSLSERL